METESIKGDLSMNFNGTTVVRVIGIIAVCVVIHMGLSTTAGLIIFGLGLCMIFLP